MSGPSSLQALAFFCGASRSDRVLCVVPRLPLADRFPLFDSEPDALAWSDLGSAEGRRGYDLVIADHEGRPTLQEIHALTGALAPHGRAVFVSRRHTMGERIRVAAWALGLTWTRSWWPRASERALATCGMGEVRGYVLHRSVEHLRHVVPPAAAATAPGSRGPGLSAWLRRRGAFYLEQRPSLVVASARPTELAEEARALWDRTNPMPGRWEIAETRLSGTNVLMVRLVHRERGSVFVRVPQDDIAEGRVAQQFGMLQHLRTSGYLLAPPPLGTGSIRGFAAFAEGGLEGQSISVRRGQSIESSRLILDMALGTIAELHRLDSRNEPLEAEDVDQHFGPRLAHLRAALGCRGHDTVPCDRLARMLREAFIGTRSRIGLCHGDAWLPNHLFSAGRPSGLVDWDMSERQGLCYMDASALAVSTVMASTGHSVTDVLEAPADAWRWADDCLARYHELTGTDKLPWSVAVWCYWLEHVSRHQLFGRLTDAWFEARVRPVLDVLPRLLPAGAD